MLEKIYYTSICMSQNTYNFPSWVIGIIKFIAKYLINVVPILMIILWLWGPDQQIRSHRYLVTKAVLAIFISMIISWILKYLFPHDRPFVYFSSCNFLRHAADYSFPSDHGTIIFSFALSFLFWHRIWSGIILMIVAFFIAWSRVYLNAHWPLDMLGGLLAGLIGCLSAQVLWKVFGVKLYYNIQHAYRVCFSFFIRNGWIHN